MTEPSADALQRGLPTAAACWVMNGWTNPWRAPTN